MAKKKHKKSKSGKHANRLRMMGWDGRSAPPQGSGLLGGLSKLLPSRRSEQFLLGAVIGLGATYVLGDAELRGKLIKSAIKLYSGLAGGIEEVKEQIADIQAEIEAEQSGAL